MKTPPGRRPPRAFTLLEMMAVVSIISILAALAVPSLKSVVADERLLAEGYSLGGWVYDSRMLALGIKRCVRIRGLNGNTPVASASEYLVDLNRLRALELQSADCETAATLTADSSYGPTSLPDFISASFLVRMVSLVPTVPAVWRPMGFLRGNSNSNFADDGVAFRITDSRGKFVVVTVTAFGQVCTGRINELFPTC